MEQLSNSKKAIKVTVITIFITAILIILKLVFGNLGKSHALVADGIHSLADLLADAILLFAIHYGAKKADLNHPYGHGRIETAATLGLSIVLLLTAIGIIWNSLSQLWTKALLPIPSIYVLWIAILAVVINEWLFRYTLKIAKVIQSDLLEANAWHNRSDAAASLIVLLGVGGSLLGFPYFDIIGAIIVGVMIGKIGIGLGWKSVRELIDTGVETEILEKLKDIIIAVPGVRTLHQLRTRTINNKILVDVHILVSSKISVSEGHYIGDQVRLALYRADPPITDVTVHVDPEDDETNMPSINLPGRDELLQELKKYWRARKLPGVEAIDKITLHYLNGKLYAEVYLPLNVIIHEAEPEHLALLYKGVAKEISCLGDIQILFMAE